MIEENKWDNIEEIQKYPRTETETGESWIELNKIQGYRRLIDSFGKRPRVRLEFHDNNYICKDVTTGDVVDRPKAVELLNEQYSGLAGIVQDISE